MDSYWITTWVVPIIASVLGGIASQLITFASNERLAKKLEWAVLALSKDSKSNHRKLLKEVVDEVEARLLAAHYEPRHMFFFALCVLPVIGISIGLPTDEPLLAQTANRGIFLYISIHILFAAHKSFVRHRTLLEYFRSPSSRYIQEVPFEENDYLNELNWRGMLGIIGMTGPLIGFAFLTYLKDTGDYPSPDWVTTAIIFYFAIGFTLTLILLPTGTRLTYLAWNNALIERSLELRRVKQGRDSSR